MQAERGQAQRARIRRGARQPRGSFEALCAGACGYLLKKTPPARLLESLREAVMRTDVARGVIALFRDVRPPKEAQYDLTPHETRLLKLIVEGHSYKSAADVKEERGLPSRRRTT